ncbi:class III lanthipeptide [Kitasatospora sp. NPDC096077]|nr:MULTISPECIES: class III lanthipeptide [Streptomyces]MBX9397648.1 class III lanthipeptide [Streptomyces sp. TRM72054]
MTESVLDLQELETSEEETALMAASASSWNC